MSFAEQDEWITAFNQNLKIKPWLIGWQGVNQEVLQTGKLEVEGKIPQDLNGYFYRNGPAQNEAYGKRYHHWFDGDGMAQKFHIANGSISHFGKIIDTYKYMVRNSNKRDCSKLLAPIYQGALVTQINSMSQILVYCH